jgi:hypothetical protein
MKHLETLNSSPHELFGDLTDEYLNDYIKENFEITIKNKVYLKDLINLYSHELLCGDATNAYKISADENIKELYDYVVIYIPIDFDILNASVSLYIKLNNKKSIKFLHNEVEDIEIDSNIQKILNINMTKKDTIFTDHRIRSPAELPKIPSFYKLLPNLFVNIINKKYIIQGFDIIKINTGNLYIDYSMSMLKYRNLLKYLSVNINFNNSVINLFLVVKSSIFSYGQATSSNEFLTKLKDVEKQCVAGKIDIEKIITFDKKISGMSTFLTDAEDFDIPTFLKNTNNFNLITIDKNGKLQKFIS